MAEEFDLLLRGNVRFTPHFEQSPTPRIVGQMVIPFEWDRHLTENQGIVYLKQPPSSNEKLKEKVKKVDVVSIRSDRLLAINRGDAIDVYARYSSDARVYDFVRVDVKTPQGKILASYWDSTFAPDAQPLG